MSDKKLNNKLRSEIIGWDDDSDIEVIRKLIAEGADVNCQNKLCGGNTPLHLAATTHNVELIRILVANGADKTLKNYEGKTAVEFVKDCLNIEIVELLKDDNVELKIDENKMTEIQTHARLYKTATLHEKIISGTLEEVKECVKEFKFDGFTTCYAFDSENNSALKVALLNNKYPIYAFLWSQNFLLGEHEPFEELKKIIRQKDEDAMVKLRQENLKYREGSHIYKLVSISSVRPILSEEYGIEKYDLVRKWYLELDGIAEIRPMLKTIAKAKSVDIIINFKSVRDVDPTAGKKVFGTTYLDSGKIIIDANREQEDILGTMAHEFCHLATYLVYGNKSKPYKKNDDINIKKFGEIVDLYNNPVIYGKENIIARVYISTDTLEKRPTENLHEEMIVRAPQILAQYNKNHERIIELKKIFPDLFDFFVAETIPDFENFYENMESMQETEDLNKILNVVTQIIDPKLGCVSKNVTLADSCEKFAIMKSNVPVLALKVIFTQLSSTQDTTRLNLFMKFEHLSNLRYLNTINIIEMARKKPSIFILSQGSELPEITPNTVTFLEKLVSAKLIATFVFHDTVDVSNIFDTFNYQFQEPQIFYWSDLKTTSQNKNLRKTILFQMRPIKFNQVFKSQYKTLQDEKLDVLETTNIFTNIVEKEVETIVHTSFYIDRTFELQSHDGMISRRQINDKEILSHAENSKIVILADVAGKF